MPDPLPISFQTDSANFDAFDRLRVSNPTTLFDSKQIHNDGGLFWDDQEISGGSTTSTWSQDTASTVLAVAATTAGKRVRQTFMRFNYQPGKSQLILNTGVLDKTGGGTGITRGWGYGDDNNGLFLYDDEGALKLVRRSYVTGSAVDTEYSQLDWNLDTMDGTGNSGVTLDMSMANIFLIDFEWLGVGRVRFGFVINGIIIYVHEINHANNIANVYMSSPNLPVRYWIENDGTGAASTIEHICSTVISEGGQQDLGTDHSQSTEATYVNANTSGTAYAVFGIRLKSANLDAIVKIIKISMLAATNDNYHWEVRINPTVAGTPGAWTDDTDSSVQYATGDVTNNPSGTTVTGGHIIDSGYVKSGSTAGDTTQNVTSQLRIGAAIDGTRDEMWLCVVPLAANADIYGGISWKEVS